MNLYFKTGAYKLNRPESQQSLENKKLGPDEAKRVALKEFEDTRNLAMRHTQLKAECYNKAKEAIQRGNTSVALYYSQVANLHKNKIDRYNQKAANCIMEVHNLTQKNPGECDDRSHKFYFFLKLKNSKQIKIKLNSLRHAGPSLFTCERSRRVP